MVYEVTNFWLKDRWQLLDELKSRLEIILQLERLFKSLCNNCWSVKVIMCLKHLVSSAKSRALLLSNALGKSFINMINKSGSRILPWGTTDTWIRNSCLHPGKFNKVQGGPNHYKKGTGHSIISKGQSSSEISYKLPEIKFEIWNFAVEIWNLKYCCRNLKLEILLLRFISARP